MKRRAFLIASLVTAPFVTAACSSAPKQIPMSADSLVTSLGGLTGLNSQQTLGGASALLGYAKNSFSGADLAALNSAIPGIDNLVAKGAGAAFLNPSSLTNMSAVTSAMSKINLPPSDLARIGKSITGSLGSSGYGDLAGKLGKLWF